jgi:hypothetical protein
MKTEWTASHAEAFRKYLNSKFGQNHFDELRSRAPWITKGVKGGDDAMVQGLLLSGYMMAVEQLADMTNLPEGSMEAARPYLDTETANNS